MAFSQNKDFSFPQKEAHFLLKSATGHLELRTNPGLSHNFSKGVGVICHPHPLLGGTMDNKVVYTIARAFEVLGYATVRFNFRGIGESSGKYDEGRGELLDLITVLKWLAEVRQGDSVYLAGFSFGSFIAACAAKQWDVKRLILVAPPVERFDFQSLIPFYCPWSVIQGDQDEVVTPATVFEWLNSISPAGDQYRVEGASHFFHGKLTILRQLLTNILSKES